MHRKAAHTHTLPPSLRKPTSISPILENYLHLLDSCDE